jgi:hypothetical protein
VGERVVIVDDVRSLSRPVDVRAAQAGAPAGRQVTVSFAGGGVGTLDVTEHRAAVWADVLRSLRATGQPAYVELDRETGMIVDLLLPARYTVGEIEGTPDGLEVELVISHARHYLRRSNPRFDELRDALERARREQTPVLVTETLDEHEIIDVRAA